MLNDNSTITKNDKLLKRKLNSLIDEKNSKLNMNNLLIEKEKINNIIKNYLTMFCVWPIHWNYLFIYLL